ncbi:hypothetical protein L6R52_15580 [Myxococcota bacterium]|nr:hypothetical protein [Myxococcota bacterium]
MSLEVARPVVTEASDVARPAWVDRPDRGATAALVFTGQSFARTLDAARAEAERDLLRAIASYVAVEVQSEFQSVEEHQSSGGSVRERQEVRDSVETRSDAVLRDVKPDGAYWEKVVASPLTPENVAYRVYVRASVSRAEIVRARLERQARRQRDTGRRSVVFLPFFASLSAPSVGLVAPTSDDTLARAFVEELARRLGDEPSLFVGDPSLVTAVLGEGRPAIADEALEKIASTLLPDVVVRGGYQRVADRIRVTYDLWDGARARVVRVRTFERPWTELFALQDELTAALRGDLATGGGGTAPAKPAEARRDGSPARLEAFAAYHAAYGHFAKGDTERALAELTRAITLRPDYPEALVRMGRVLERMGRYGRVGDPPRAPDRSRRAPRRGQRLNVCTSEGHSAVVEAEHGDRETPLIDEDRSWSAADATDVDEVIRWIWPHLSRRGPIPPPPVRSVPHSAIDAYALALVAARAAGDGRLEGEVMIALGDLLQRVDRVRASLPIYLQAGLFADARRDDHLRALVLYSGGVAARKLGRLFSSSDAPVGPRALILRITSDADAWTLLESALRIRARLAEKPYLLELHNELGAVASEAGRFDLARAQWLAARRIADELGNDYLVAVLDNNVGVLDLRQGRTQPGEEAILRAFDVLQRLGEAEGRISSGINAAHVAALVGDFTTAETRFSEVDRLTRETGQLGRRAELEEQRAWVLARRRDPGALLAFARAWQTYGRAGRTGAELARIQNAFAALELRIATSSEERIDELTRVAFCLEASLTQARARASTSPVTTMIASMNAETLELVR